MELFFQLNHKFNWLQKSPPANAHLKKNEQLSSQIFQSLKSNPIYQWRSLVSDEDKDRISDEGEDASQVGPLQYCLDCSPLRKSLHFVSVMKSAENHKIIYASTITIDDHGRRITPFANNSEYNILTFGDSYTFGEGINDDQTFQYQLSKMRPQARIYNLGLIGGGPADFYREASTLNSPRLNDISHRKTIAIYSFIDHHMERIFCRSNCLRKENSWIMQKPYYTQSADKFIYHGDFHTRVDLNSTYSLFNESALLEFFNVVWPLRFQQWHFDFMADMISSAQENLKQLYPDLDFYFVIYPGAANRYGTRAIEAVEKKHIHVLDYSRISPYTMAGGHDEVNGDGHPSPILQLDFAYLLNRDLPNP